MTFDVYVSIPRPHGCGMIETYIGKVEGEDEGDARDLVTMSLVEDVMALERCAAEKEEI
jgi:hypothetical protein